MTQTLCLTGGDSEAFERAKRVGYVVHHAEGLAAGRYWRCHVNRYPFIAIRKSGGCAEVSCDLSPGGVLAGFGAEAMKKVDALFGWPPEEYGPRTSIAFVHAEEVPAGQAETIAFRLYEAAIDCVPPRPAAGALFRRHQSPSAR